MWRSHLSVAFRLLARNRAYAAITVGGLALGLAGCLLILSYINYERGYDDWLPDSERIFQVQTVRHEPGQPVVRSQNSPFPLRDRLAAAFPQIEAITVLRSGPAPLMREGQPVFLDAAIVDPAFFRIFRLEFVSGSAARALPDTQSIVITESEARKQFGTADASGRTITMGAGEGRRDFVVSGVIRDLPTNSSLRLAVIFRSDPADFAGLPPEIIGWSNLDQQHYVKLRPGVDVAALNASFPAWERRVIPPTIVEGRPVALADRLELALAPIRSVHLGPAQEGALRPGGDPRTLATFTIVALLTLGMAIINFVNLSTARATLRAREVVLRKLLGATRPQLVVQLLGESFLLAATSMLLALAMAELAAPWLSASLGADLRIDYLGQGGMLLPGLGLFALTGLLGGLYPAFYLSGFRPAAVLRANMGSAEAPGRGWLRTVLVVVQFAIAIGLIACTAIIYAQTRYAETVDPGYRRDGLIQIDAAWRFAGSDRYAAARAQMLAVPGVVAAGRTDLALAATNSNVVTVRTSGIAQDVSVGSYAVDPDFFRTMDVRLLAGRALSDRFGQDRVPPAHDETTGSPSEARAERLARGINVVVNRRAATALGFRSPSNAVGRTIGVAIDAGTLTPATIVGVVEDTRLRTARHPLEPLIYSFDPGRTSQVIVRYAAARPGDVMEGLGRVWQRFEPEIPFQGRFAEDILAETYAADRARGALFGAFAALAVVIACLGLYSLAAFATERRRKEIGIRKVFGARVRDIVKLLVWQFTKPVVVANLVAWPVAWWAMRDWLDTFDVRVPLGPTPFALAGLLALGIALGTIASHAIRVARANPIHALRHE